MWIGGICGRKAQMLLWIYQLEAFVRFFTGKETRARMEIRDWAEVLVLLFEIPMIVQLCMHVPLQQFPYREA